MKTFKSSRVNIRYSFINGGVYNPGIAERLDVRDEGETIEHINNNTRVSTWLRVLGNQQTTQIMFSQRNKITVLERGIRKGDPKGGSERGILP